MVVKIAPSVMCANWCHLEQDIRALEEARVDYLHFDVMDGHFVPNLALAPDMLRAIRELTTISPDIHLMVERPESFIGMFDIHEGDIVTVHQEATVHLNRILKTIRDLGAKPAVAVNPATSLHTIEEVLDDVDMVLVMTVNPGFAGQSLVPSTLAKIRNLRTLLESRGLGHVDIEVDGNVSLANASKMLKAGANVFVAGTSSVFARGSTIRKSVEQLRELLKE